MIYVVPLAVSILFIVITLPRPQERYFYLGSGRYGSLISAVSIFAAFTGGGALINTSGLAAKYGYWAFFDVIPAAAGLLIAAVLVYFRFYGREFSRSFFDIKSNIYDKRAISVHYAQIAFLYVLVVAIQLRAVSTVAAQIDISPSLAVVFCCLSVGLYAFRGFDAVTRTDVAQVLLMLPLYLILIYAAHQPAPPTSSHSFDVMPTPLIVALCLPFLFVPISQEVHQRGAAANSDQSVWKAYAIAGFLYLLLASMVVHAFASKPQMTLSSIIQGDNVVAAIIAIVALQAAIFSTLDTATNIASHAAQKISVLSKIRASIMQVLVLLCGAAVFLFFSTVLSLVLFALFLYMTGPALTFLAIWAGVHPRYASIIGALFIALQGLVHFRVERLISADLLGKYALINEPVEAGLILLLGQFLILMLIAIYRRYF